MKRRLLSDALNQLDAAWVEEAAEEIPAARRRSLWPRLIAAAAAFCLVFVAVATFLPRGGITVTAYAAGADGTSTSLTSDSIRFATGRLQPNGELTGHPLLFHLAGESIQSVRFSCKNEKIRFTDLTEQREEFGLAQNFTVPYGKDAAAYEFLLIDWVPERLIAALREGTYASFSALPDELRQDTIVIEIRDYRGRTAVKAITVALQDDGSFAAAFDDYTVGSEDDFVRRPDTQSIPRAMMYGYDTFDVDFLNANGETVPPERGWHITADVRFLRISWKGREPDSVRVFYTPSGTETETETELLLTAVPNSAESVLLLPADVLQDENLMGHLTVSLQYGNLSIQSEAYNVIYDPN